MNLYDLTRRVQKAETTADGVAILEEELIRFIEEARPVNKKLDFENNLQINSQKIAYNIAVVEYQSNLLKLLTKEK